MRKFMRLTLTLLAILFLNVSSYGQWELLKGNWISIDQDFIGIQSRSSMEFSNEMSNKLLEKLNLGLCIKGDTLNFQHRLFNSDSSFITSYDLKIISLNDSDLIVKPISTYSKKFFQDRSILKFVKQEYCVDTTIKFEKITYQIDGVCLVPCPSIDLEIDNKRNISLKADFFKDNFERDSLLSGNFTGILSETTYSELIKLLQTCNLRTLSFDENLIIDDAPEITLKIYYNCQIKYLRTKDPPLLVNDLLDFLNSLHKRVQLERTDNQNEN